MLEKRRLPASKRFARSDRGSDEATVTLETISPPAGDVGAFPGLERKTVKDSGEVEEHSSHT